MRKGIIGVVFAAAITAGCATSNYTSGVDFNSANVSRIEHGRTTEADLLRMFGPPFSKHTISATSTKWMYIYTTGTAKVASGLFSTKIESSGRQKVLDVLIENGVVVNHSYTNNPIPSSIGTSTSY